jgi:hypothetical protein
MFHIDATALFVSRLPKQRHIAEFGIQEEELCLWTQQVPL